MVPFQKIRKNWHSGVILEHFTAKRIIKRLEHYNCREKLMKLNGTEIQFGGGLQVSVEVFICVIN